MSYRFNLIFRKEKMKVLLVYPKYPDTFWSFAHALRFIGKRLKFIKEGTNFIALSGIPLDTSPGDYHLYLSAILKNSFVLKRRIPIRIRDVTGEWDFVVDVKGVRPDLLNEITREIRRGCRDVLKTSTSIIFDEYK